MCTAHLNVVLEIKDLNRFNLNVDYFNDLVAREFSPDVIKNQTPEDLARAFMRAAVAANPKVTEHPEFRTGIPTGAKVVNLSFDPNEVDDPGSEFGIAQEASGVVLRFWALYKQRFLTSDRFAKFLSDFAEVMSRYERKVESAPYNDIESFIEFTRGMGVGMCGMSCRRDYNKFVLDNWDYFNLNIQRKVCLTWETQAAYINSMEV
jgi:hypothetical protein